MKEPYIWDSYSDQPYPLKDRAYKKSMRKKEFVSLIKTFFVSIFILPFSLLMIPFIKRKHIETDNFFCIGIDYEREPQLTKELIEELGVKRVLVRFKLWQIQDIGALENFLRSFKDVKVTLKIMQDREHVEDAELLKRDLDTIFERFKNLVDIFEIGTTINRAKWGFFSVDEYSRFYKVAYDLKMSKYKDIKLIGSGVIDFEYHFTAHTLFNLYNYRYDGVSSLLYVDRRGAPENKQIIFTLLDKIALLSSIVSLSLKTKNELHITETNWPLSGTAPYAPTSEYECVSEDEYADYMLRYYLLAFASQSVNSLSWHQLIAPGYGLIDNREGIRKREAYEVYKYMVHNLKDARFVELKVKESHYIFESLSKDNGVLEIYWSLNDKVIKRESDCRVFDKCGNEIYDEVLNIGSSPIYIMRNK